MLRPQQTNPDHEMGFQSNCYPVSGGIWTLFPGLCKGCALCVEKCPSGSIGITSELGCYGTPVVGLHDENCIKCSACEDYCPDAAIRVTLC
ncbi:MAG TPA: 4Fe-4S binding protein [Bacillota bacterium]|nr:4Fe-4S binding protein [Bacillota bacterium]